MQRETRIAVVWERTPSRADVALAEGRLAGLALPRNAGRVEGNGAQFRPGARARLEVRVADARCGAGAHATCVTVRAPSGDFTFFLRDVSSAHPVWIPEYGAAVLPAGDPRDYAAVVRDIRARSLRSQGQRIADEPEERFEAAAARNRDLVCPTWLGLGRDMRIFRMVHSESFGCCWNIQCCHHSLVAAVPQVANSKRDMTFWLGPGASCRVAITRRLEEGCLPILCAEQREDDIVYHLTAFATLERGPLAPGRVRGTDWRAAYLHMHGQMATPEEAAALRPLVAAETDGREEDVVCCVRVEAVNRGSVPRYAWFKAPTLHGVAAQDFDGATGFSTLPDAKRVFCVTLLDGRPLPQNETAVLVPPGGATVFDLRVPHQPLPPARARVLARLDFADHREACRRFWRRKLDAGARIHVPERAIDERIRAGLLHLDLATIGRGRGGPALATVGWYTPIGSESSPIIQFFDAMGWHKLAERAIDFFLARQRPDGFMQNFGGYQLETGPVLWTMGEHYRLTRDDRWAARVKPRVLKACDYLLQWRARNQRPELRGRGYGLQDGKVADPQDFYHSFMLNALSCIGVQRAAELLTRVAPAEARRLAQEAAAFRDDIRTAFFGAVARSPVVPAGDGSWVPTAPPWAEHRGPVSLYAEGGQWFTHGAFGGRDSLIGALYLILGEVLDPREPAAEFLLRSHQVLFTVANAGLSQPYYCRHDYAHLMRGEVKAFLKTYYNQLTALQDRQTYTFWEHYFFASQHKTHEEGWFLMQTRWMLWKEEGDTLSLLKGIPRRWLADGESIVLEKVASAFGKITFRAQSDLRRGVIRATVSCPGARRPRRVAVRLPHPEGRGAAAAGGGAYDPVTETVAIADFKGTAEVVLRF